MRPMKTLFALILAVLLAAIPALAESDDESRIRELEQELAETKEQMEYYRQFYEQQIVAEFDGEVLLLDDVRPYYEACQQMYAGYSMDVNDYYARGELEQQILEERVQYAVILKRAQAQGIVELTDEVLADFAAKADEANQSNVDYLWDSFAGDDRTEEEITSEINAYLKSIGYSRDDLYNDYMESYVMLAVYDYATAGVGATVAQVEAKYQEMLANDQAIYSADHDAYEEAFASGSAIAWHPEQVRLVQHILIAFDDSQSARYASLTGERTQLRETLSILSEGQTDSEGRTVEEIQARIDAIADDLDALYAEITPDVDAAYDRLNAGESFEDVMANLSAEPDATAGYAVCSDSTYFVEEFTAGAWLLNAPGDVGDPVRTQFGIHILRYVEDVTAGEVPLSDIEEAVRTAVNNDLMTQAYQGMVDQWMADAAPTYYPDRFLH